MQVKTKLKLLSILERVPFFRIRALRIQRTIVDRDYDQRIRKTKDHEERAFLDAEQYFETKQYDEAIRSIASRQLISAADAYFIHLPDLKWEDGEYGERYLDQESLSRLNIAVREQRDKRREFWLKLVPAITGLIGAAIGVIALLLKK